MVTSAPVKNPFIDLAVNSDQFTGTIIKSSWDQRENGLFWNIIWLDEDTGRLEKQSGIRNVDIATSGRARYKSSSKNLVLEAFAAAGIPRESQANMGADDYEGLRFTVSCYTKQNGGGFPDTVLYLPVTQLENADPHTVAEHRAKWDARLNSNGGGRSAAAKPAPAPFVPSNYSSDQLEKAAALLDGLNRSKRGDIAAAASRANDSTVTQGILDGSIITAAVSHGVLKVDDGGNYTFNID